MAEKKMFKNECIPQREGINVVHEESEKNFPMDINEDNKKSQDDKTYNDLGNCKIDSDESATGTDMVHDGMKSANQETPQTTTSTETIGHMYSAKESTAFSEIEVTDKMTNSKDIVEREKYPDSVIVQEEGPGDSDSPHVLDPDNPLMIKFQKALRDLLQKQLNKLNDEVSEMNSNLRIKSREREDLGVNLFNLQEEVNHSQKQLASHNKLLAELEDTRATLEKQVNQTQVIYKEAAQKIAHFKEQEEKVRLEIEYLKNFECQLKQWESDYNSELTVSQLIADKTEKQKEEMSKAKQKQDILLLRLRQAVLGLESKQEQLRAQKEVKLRQQESLRETIAEGSADLEALQSEQVRLTRIWNGVVISLQQRDRVFNNVQTDLQKAKESFQLMLSEIEGYRRVEKLEMIQSEKAMNILNRLETEHDDLLKTFSKNNEFVLELEAEYSNFSGIVKQTEDSLQTALMDGKVLSQQNNYQQRELERLTQQKISLEMQILEKLQDQSKHDKALQHHARTIKTLKDSNKIQEMSFMKMENQIAETMVEVEKTRGAILDNENLLKQATDEAEKYGKDLSQLESNLKQSMTAMQNKMLLNDQLTKKLDSILAHLGTSEESPQEVRIKAIEVEIEEAAQEAEKKQAFWLRLQSHIVRLSEERQRQLQELNLLYKQVHILTQRALKIEHETEKHRRGRKDAEQQINDLDLSLNKMTKELHKKRGYKENLDKENMLIQTESICILKDMEIENVEQEEDLTNLEKNNLMLNEEILDLKQQCLAWEKKIILASETKQMNEEDNRATGELSQMKVEIHRMDVRFSHLRKVQDTLVKDLEHCIMRRESLLDEADAREKRSVTNFGSVSNRIVFERKLENLSNRTKQAKMEGKSIASQLENDLPNEYSQSLAALEEAEKTLQREQQAVTEGKKQVDDAYFMKQQKLEMLVRLQKKVRLYTKVKEGKHRLLYRTESALEAEMCKQRTVCNDLLEVIAVLQQHFPSLQMQILRLQSILQASNVQ